MLWLRLPQEVGEDDGGGTRFAHCTVGVVFVSFIVCSVVQSQAIKHAHLFGKKVAKWWARWMRRRGGLGIRREG